MTRPARMTILCEDIQQACFVRRFLTKRGWTRHDLHEEIHPPGAGSAVQGVQQRFPRELRAYRSQCNHLHCGLIAIIDADNADVADRVRAFDTACHDQGVPPRRPDERVLFVIPKRRIETWLAFLRGETVDETASYPRYDRESRCHPDADRLDEQCRRGVMENQPPPPSLRRCCDEFEAFWERVQSPHPSR